MTREFRQILAELEMLSHGAVQAWDKSAPPCDKDFRPNGDTFPIHERYAIEYMLARTDNGRQDVVDEARRELREWKGQRKPKPTVVRTKEVIDAEMEAFTGLLPAQVARTTGGIVTESAIREWRCNQIPPRDPITGKEFIKDEPKKDAVVRLKREGLSPSEIGRSMNMSRQAVSQMLKRAA